MNLIKNKNIANSIKAFEENFDAIPTERKKVLNQFAEHISFSIEKFDEAKVTIICTHNSRRSHLGQLWLRVAASYYGYPIKTYSGGTEATAIHPNIINTLEKNGFSTKKIKEGENSVYHISATEEENTDKIFSKVYSDEYNPQENFIAVMVCTEADGGCPFVAGSIARVSLPFTDPKIADGTDLVEEAYQKASDQIGLEMFYAASQVK